MKRYQTLVLTTISTIAIFSLSLTVGCNKPKHSCYSAALEKEYKDKFCTMDCPGVIGCDGKTYCNACMAAKEGIAVVQFCGTGGN